MLPKLPKHVGANRLYETYRLHLYRRHHTDAVRDSLGKLKILKRYPWELIGSVSPLYIKNPSEKLDFEAQVVHANRTAGPYTWMCRWERLGNDTVKTKETLGRPSQLSGDPEKDSRQTD